MSMPERLESTVGEKLFRTTCLRKSVLAATFEREI